VTARILVTGGTGFVGSHVVEALLRATPFRLRLLVHRTPPGRLGERVEVTHADLAEPDSLRGACEAVNTVLHLACEISDDEERCELVNGRGTEALVGQARRSGVRRVVYLSNTAVYGYAVHRGSDESEALVNPATPVSRSRLRAERAVLASGGTVLRPTFVYGDGDTRFIPAIIRALERFGFIVGGGRARLSVISATDLARLVAQLILVPRDGDERQVFHANDNRPVRFLDITRALHHCVGLGVPALSLPYGIARHLLRLAASNWSPSAAHRLFLATHDHFYNATAVWTRVGLSPGPPLTEGLKEHAAWYRRFFPAAARAKA
jgi:2-alkyl-3-oxoalkanoate reductase